MMQTNHNSITEKGTKIFYHSGMGAVKEMIKPENTKTIPTAIDAGEAGAFIKRVGNTNYRVGVYFSATSEETARDKILRLVRNEMASEQAAEQ